MLNCDLLLFPVHVGLVHWAAAAVDLRGRRLLYWDSLCRVRAAVGSFSGWQLACSRWQFQAAALTYTCVYPCPILYPHTTSILYQEGAAPVATTVLGSKGFA